MSSFKYSNKSPPGTWVAPTLITLSSASDLEQPTVNDNTATKHNKIDKIYDLLIDLKWKICIMEKLLQIRNIILYILKFDCQNTVNTSNRHVSY